MSSPACASVSSTSSAILRAPARVEPERRLDPVERQPLDLLQRRQLVAQRAGERGRVLPRQRQVEEAAEQLQLLGRKLAAGAPGEVAHSGRPPCTTSRTAETARIWVSGSSATATRSARFPRSSL